jgi:plasmid maintenance system killer protein
MNIRFKANKLEKQLTVAKEIKKTFGVNAGRVSQRMEDIRASPNLESLCKIPQANCHPLTGDRNGLWTVDISKNHRLLFEIDQDPVPMKNDGGIDRIRITDVKIITHEDYH